MNGSPRPVPGHDEPTYRTEMRIGTETYRWQLTERALHQLFTGMKENPDDMMFSRSGQETTAYPYRAITRVAITDAPPSLRVEKGQWP